jgi:formate dehydrogenase iron-sulfur subunit
MSARIPLPLTAAAARPLAAPAVAPPVAAPPAAPGYGDRARPRVGFFTDTTVCIGCKACEVACKDWNDVPENPFAWAGASYDNTGSLGANAWRHVAFVEQRVNADGLRWLMSSDVCKHCTTAACLDVCPTGALFRTEFGTVVVQPDVCNGCGYCVPACPYGVLDRRPGDGRVWKCTLCYDRLKVGAEPACAKACPTDSINFGSLEEMYALARGRLDEVVAAGVPGAQLYGDGPSHGVDGTGSVFLLLDDPEVYGLPPDPIATTKDLKGMWGAAAVAAGAIVAAVFGVFAGGRR